MDFSHDTVALKRPEVKPCQRVVKLNTRRNAMGGLTGRARACRRDGLNGFELLNRQGVRYWGPQIVWYEAIERVSD